MNIKHLVIAVGLGLGLSLALLGVLGGAAIPIVAAPAPRALSDATPIHYVTITGTDSGDCSTPAGVCRTVQYAVDRAGEGDEVRVATGVYTDVNTYGGLAQVVYISKTVTVRGGYTTTNWSVSNPISYPSTLDARGQGRGLYITGDISPTVEGLHITGGDATGLSGGSYKMYAGGGVCIVTATVTLKENRIFENNGHSGGGVYLQFSSTALNANGISNNAAYEGGGVYLFQSDAMLGGNTIFGNTAYEGGGLDLLSSDATIRENTVSTNTANVGGGLYLNSSDAVLESNTIVANIADGDDFDDGGGGVYLSGSRATLISNTISGNRATRMSGGGLNLVFHSDATLTSNTIRDNTASQYGGGVYLEESDATFSRNAVYSNTGNIGGGLFLVVGDPTLNANAVTANFANFAGGGLVLYDSGGTLVNNVIADNQAAFSGSGVSINGGSPRLLHTTVARNVGQGTGVLVTDGAFSSTVIMTNTILLSQTNGIVVTSGNTATLEATLWGTGTWANGTDWSGDGTLFTGTVNIWGDPAFEDPDAGDYHIRPESAALDRGVNAGVTADIDGEPRPMGLGYDIGADETGLVAVRKRANPDPVQAGERLTYTLRVTNTGAVDLHATITDVLPQHITPGETPSGTLILPGGLLTWTALIPAPGGVWAETLVVTTEAGYAGPLTNVVRVATAEGATGVYTATSSVVLTPTNQSPDAPFNPDPADSAIGLPLTQTLRWQGGDPDGDPVTYTVSFGISDPPPPVSQVQTTSYDPGGLLAGTIYYWAVTASDGISSAAGPIWRFTTQHFVYLPVVLKN